MGLVLGSKNDPKKFQKRMVDKRLELLTLASLDSLDKLLVPRANQLRQSTLLVLVV
jgi:hypothetical protein